jgi:tetraacyldisaccharide 4'-kinase
MRRIADLPFVAPQDQPWWYRAVARPLAALSGWGVRLRALASERGWIRAHILPGKVISVGNLAVGGTGKSPVVIAIAKALIARRLCPAILTRGYGVSLGKNDFLVLQNGKLLWSNCDATVFPDEALMQSRALPEAFVIVGRRRVHAATQLLRLLEKKQGESENVFAPDAWILDDGFQHLQIKRDVDLVLIDAERGLGSGLVLPAGFLREGEHALARASHVWLTRNSSSSGIKSAAPGGLVARNPWSTKLAGEVFFESGEPLATTEKCPEFDRRFRVLAVAGIARPEVFIANLRAAGIQVERQLIVPDHACVDAAQLREICSSVDAVVTTEKDFSRQMELYISQPKPTYLIPWTARIAPAQMNSLLAIAGPA